jgi:Bifunctional DNA primase/polymerase, N-terminal
MKWKDADFIPVIKGTKKPLGQSWQIKKLDDEIFSTSNIALVAGNKWVLLDIEGPKKPTDGTEHLRYLQQAFEDLPMAPTYKTPSGGLGIIFQASKTIQTPFVDLSKSHGLELRTGNHYSLIPNSTYEGANYQGAYEWVIPPEDVEASEDEIPEVPTWLVAWFKNNIVERIDNGQERIQEDYCPHYKAVIAENIHYLDADSSYPFWWSVMAVCHRGDAKDIFVNWSKTGKQKFNDKTLVFIDSQWSALERNLNGKLANGEPLLGLSWFLDQVIKVKGAPQLIEFAPLPKVQEAQQEIPCTGIIKRIVEEITAQLPHQKMYGHLAALCILGTMAQRRIRVPKTQAMNFYALVTPPNSQKSVLYQLIMSTLKEVLPNSIIRHPASSQALQEEFAAEPNRFYGSDEAIEVLRSIYATKKSIATPKSEMFNLMLQYFGSPKIVLGQRNKKDEDSSKSSTAPRLTWLAIGTTDQWRELIGSPDFVSSGMASRFAPFTGISCHESFEEWHERMQEDVSLSDELLNDLSELYGVYFCQLGAMPSLQTMQYDKNDLFLHYKNFYESISQTEQFAGNLKSVFGRLKERALWYAGIHSWANKRKVIEAVDFRYGCALCAYHVNLWQQESIESDDDEISQCKRVVIDTLLKKGPTRLGTLHRALPRKFRDTSAISLRREVDRQLIESRIMTKDKTTGLLSLTTEYLVATGKKMPV